MFRKILKWPWQHLHYINSFKFYYVIVTELQGHHFDEKLFRNTAAKSICIQAKIQLGTDAPSMNPYPHTMLPLHPNYKSTPLLERDPFYHECSHFMNYLYRSEYLKWRVLWFRFKTQRSSWHYNKLLIKFFMYRFYDFVCVIRDHQG